VDDEQPQLGIRQTVRSSTGSAKPISRSESGVSAA
jgi:hypothetical protein